MNPLPQTAEPSTPDPATVALVAALLRHLLTIAAGLGIGVGTYSDSTLTVIAGALCGVAGIVWSFYQKYSAARAAHRRAVMSAKAGAAVQPGG